MSSKLCVCLTEVNTQSCIEFVSTCDSDLIEHRMDFMEPIAGLDEIYRTSKVPIIATCRSLSDGGKFRGRLYEWQIPFCDN